jgi:hypothetical protein
MKMAVFWDVAPCTVVDIGLDRALMMETVRTSRTSVNPLKPKLA